MTDKTKYSFKRYEKKYFISPEQQDFLLNEIRSFTNPDEYGKYTICNIYYDTDDWRLIRASLEKPIYKEKLRVRSYGIPSEDGKAFIEMKKKYSGVVYKRRITVKASETEPLLYALEPLKRYGQIGSEISWFQNFYKAVPKVFIGYDRTAFAGIYDPEIRITFDTGMRWRTNDLNLCLGDSGRPLISDNRILMEIKTPGACPLWLTRLLSEIGAFPTSFSKYGTCYSNYIALSDKQYALSDNQNTIKEAHLCA